MSASIPKIGEPVRYYRRKAGGKLHGCETVDAVVLEHQKKRPSMMDKIYIRIINDTTNKKRLVNLDSIVRLPL